MYVNSLIFMVTASKSLKYKTSMYIKSWKKPQLVPGLTEVIQIYSKYGLVINFINGNNGVETFRDDFPRVKFIITAAEKNVLEA